MHSVGFLFPSIWNFHIHEDVVRIQSSSHGIFGVSLWPKTFIYGRFWYGRVVYFPSQNRLDFCLFRHFSNQSISKARANHATMADVVPASTRQRAEGALVRATAAFEANKNSRYSLHHKIANTHSTGTRIHMPPPR
jgi:hypothetical protein